MTDPRVARLLFMTACTLQPPNMPIFVTKLLGLELLQHVRRLSRRLGYRRPVASTPAALRAPDTALAVRTKELVERLSSPAIANHSHRTFVFAVAIGTHRKMKFDRELLYLSTMMHDLGLSESLAGPEPFEMRGANAARAFCVDNGIDSERADLVHEAIALHTSVMWNAASEQTSLVQLGSGADVIGYHIEDIARQTVTDAVYAFPRLGLKRELHETLAREAKQNPTMALAAHLRLGFGRRIDGAPFAE